MSLSSRSFTCPPHHDATHTLHPWLGAGLQELGMWVWLAEAFCPPRRLLWLPPGPRLLWGLVLSAPCGHQL